MTTRVVWSPYGAPALDALRTEIHRIKGGDTLARVTVIVARGAVGLGVRRALAGASGSDGRPGVANVHFTTLSVLAEELARPALVAAGSSPLSDTVLRAAIRLSLADSDALQIGASIDHPATIEAISATYRELRPLTASTLDALANVSARAGLMVSLVRAIRARTEAWYDEVDALAGARHAARQGRGTTGHLGEVILYLPSSLNGHEVGLLRTVAANQGCTAVLGLSGEADADQPVRLLAQRLRPDEEEVAFLPVASSRVEVVVSAPTADAEVLLVLRNVLARLSAGTPLERMAVVHGGSAHYATLLHAQLDRSGIPYNGGGTRPLSATVAGRLLLGALGLPERGWRRDDVTQWLATGPLHHGGRPVPASRWDILSAEAGVSEGLGEWRDGLTALAASRRALADRGNPDLVDEEHWRAVLIAEAEQCVALSSFIESLAEQLASCPTSWALWGAWATRLWRGFCGGMALERWPVEERAAADAVLDVLARLGELDRVGLPWSTIGARAVLESELAQPAPQTSRFGTGLWVAPLDAVVGLSVDVLYIVGSNDGVFPAPPRDDVMLSDAERGAVSTVDDIPLRGARAAGTRRDYLAALAGSASVHLSFARGNPRDGRELRPSRWALDAIGALSGHEGRLYASQLEALAPTANYRVIPSWSAALRAAEAPMDLHDRDLQSLANWTAAGRSLTAHPLCVAGSVLARGESMVSGRGRRFTRYEGNLGHVEPSAVRARDVWSASGLERFASCPRRSFFESTLGVAPRPLAERATGVDRGALGSLVHRILEQFVRPQIGRRPGAEDNELFSPERLRTVAEEEIERFEGEGLSGPPTAWAVERTRLLRTLRRFAAVDRAWRQREGMVTLSVEEPFGQDGRPYLEVPVPQGQPVRFRGRIDRVDESAAGVRTVTDYKTGQAKRFKGVADDPLDGGLSVQLSLYAAALGADDAHPVTAAFWCVNERENFARHGVTVDQEVMGALGTVVGVLAGAASAGHFPAHPSEEDDEFAGPCTYCPYTSVCPGDRAAVWQRVRQDPTLGELAQLVGAS